MNTYISPNNNINTNRIIGILNLLVTVSELSSLLPIARFWESNEVVCTKEPFSISGVSNNFDANTQYNEGELLNTLYELMDYYEHHRHNLFIKSYFDILTSPIIDRPIFDLEESSSALCCLPYNPRCFIDATGQVGICEKTCDELRIGKLHRGFDYEKINQITQQMAEIKKTLCSTCRIQRFCNYASPIISCLTRSYYKIANIKRCGHAFHSLLHVKWQNETYMTAKSQSFVP